VSAGSLIKRAGSEILVHVPTPSDKQSEPPAPAGEADPAPRPTRRVFTPAYKLAMVAEYENAPNGEKGAILRREGLYSSHIVEWTRARDAGVLSGDSQCRDRSENAARQRRQKLQFLQFSQVIKRRPQSWGSRGWSRGHRFESCQPDRKDREPLSLDNTSSVALLVAGGRPRS
jgi:hypothetical protein